MQVTNLQQNAQIKTMQVLHAGSGSIPVASGYL
jgi:hypothetical protein